MKLSRVLTLLFSDDDDQAEKTVDASFSQVVSDVAVATKGVGLTELLVPATNGSIQVPFGSLTTAKRVLLVSDTLITVTFNNGADPIPMRPRGTFPSTVRADRAVAYWEGDITKIVLANAQANNATVLFALAGV